MGIAFGVYRGDELHIVGQIIWVEDGWVGIGQGKDILEAERRMAEKYADDPAEFLRTVAHTYDTPYAPVFLDLSAP